jgi:hypothetical protein
VSPGRFRRQGRGPAAIVDETDLASPVVRAALQEIDRLTVARPDLAEPGVSLARFVRAAFALEGSPRPALRPGEEGTEFLIERIRDGWLEGVPAARVVRPALDPGRLAARAGAIAACAGPGPGADAAGPFRDLAATSLGRVEELAMTLLVEGDEALGVALEALGMGHDFATSALRLVLLGELGDWSARICSHLDETSWPRGDCPVCAAWPALTEARGLEQRRYLRCDHCGACWPCDRFRCPFCGRADHRHLRYLHAEGEQDRYRLALCDACGGRIRSIATLTPLSPPGLLVAELAMVHLDLIEPGSGAGTP